MTSLVKYQIQPEDTWNVDYTVAHLLERLFDAFLERSAGVPMGMKKEEWDTIITDIRNGFRAYREHTDGEWYGLQTSAEDTKEMEDIALARLRKSLILMSEWFPAFWW